jgi:serine/threonine protein kinase
MLKVNPKDRIKAAEILSHPYLSGSEMDVESDKYTLSPASTVSSVKGISFSQAERNF